MTKTDRKTHQIVDRLSDAYYRASADFSGYLDFRTSRKLTRTAQYPDSHLMHFSILAGLVLFEGLANAYFFSKGSDLGLLGGWIQAITVAFTNVIAAFFLIGFLGIRSLVNPNRPFSFAVAVVGVPVAVMFAVFLNFAAGHYRDLLELNAASLALGGVGATGEILTPVTRALTFQPFETLEALLLFILGVTFAAIAAFKGATFDDSVIGYGAAQRKVVRSSAHLAAVLKQVPWESSTTGQSVGARTHDLAKELKVEIDEYFARQALAARRRADRSEAEAAEADGIEVESRDVRADTKPPFPSR